MDDFHEPKPHDAATKSTVTSVLNRIGAAGQTVLSLLSGLLAAALILYSGYVLYDTYYTQNRAFSSSWDMLQYKPEIIDDADTLLASQDTLAAINQDYRAWLTMYDTRIDYPVMQAENDLYYASHDIYGNSSLTGAIYLAGGSTGDFSDAYNLIYGHHMDNGAMFGGLDLYLDESYINAHREGVVVTPVGVFDLKVFAVAKTDAYESEIYNVGPGRTVGEILSFLSDPSDSTEVTYLDLAAAEGATKITALSTCASAETNGRLVVFCVTTQRNLMNLEALGYEGIYDAQRHGVTATPSYEEGTVVEYSTDGGVTWSEEIPTRKDVGVTTVLVRATNEIYGRATATAEIIVHPRPVTVMANPDSKVYGTEDPAFTATVEGVIDDARIAYSVSRPGAGTDENVGTYADAIIPAGASEQGNYTVSFVPAEFTITPAPMSVVAVGYEGVYDAATHPGSGQPSVTEGTTLEYSVDGGTTWTTTPPTILNVGSQDFIVRATNPNYVTATAAAQLIVTPRPVTVTANPAAKVYGENDPAFSAAVSGTLGRDTVSYTVARPGTGTDEDVGTYADAIVAAGDAVQGNYTVTYIPADFTITAADRLTVIGIGYEGVYDGNSHPAQANVNIPGGTIIEFSTDGTTWTRVAPTITDVGSQRIYVRATNPNYDTATAELTLTVTPRPVTVTANDATKQYGDPDPAFTATVTGVIDGYTIEYTLARTGNDENAGTYPNVIVPTGQERQGNYTVNYVPGTLTITPKAMTLSAEGYDGMYDAETHTLTASVDVAEGTVIEYSTDGGKTWSTEKPEIRDVGEITVQVRATNPNYETQTAEVKLIVRPRIVTVTADGATKFQFEDDPEFTATVEGVIDGFEIVYTVSRTGDDETPGNYKNVIVPSGEELQGNYVVTYVPASFSILTVTPTYPTNPEPELPDKENSEPESPLAAFFGIFKPQGGSNAAWALVNLLCLIGTIYLVVPLFHLRDKFGRAKLMKQINAGKVGLLETEELTETDELERERIEKAALDMRTTESDDPVTEEEFSNAVQALYFKSKKFLKRLWIGFGAEVVVAVLALLCFIWTEDMRLPMILIDQWTPLMLLFLAGNWVLDIGLARYREKAKAETEEKEEAVSAV